MDDDVGVSRTLKMYLDENGAFEVRVENVGSRAVATARDFRPDLIFLDIVMPDADGGGAVAAEINADPVLQGTPIVFLTALVSQEETAGGQGLIGGHPFLARPVDPDAVIACIGKHARR